MSRTFILHLAFCFGTASFAATTLAADSMQATANAATAPGKAAAKPKSRTGAVKTGGAKGEADKSAAEDKTLSGMSILGNQDAPKALVIVPWKSSQLGDTLGIENSLDDSRAPVDKEVFMRELSYYEIRANSK